MSGLEGTLVEPEENTGFTFIWKTWEGDAKKNRSIRFRAKFLNHLNLDAKKLGQ